MSSPFRLYNFVNRFTKTEYTELINLNKVISIELKNKLIKFTLDEKDSIFGNFIIFNGGGSVVKRIYHNTNEEAKQEFEDIQTHLNQIYKKS